MKFCRYKKSNIYRPFSIDWWLTIANPIPRRKNDQKGKKILFQWTSLSSKLPGSQSRKNFNPPKQSQKLHIKWTLSLKRKKEKRKEKERKGKERKKKTPTRPPPHTHKDLDQIVWRSSDWNLWTKQRRKTSDTEINLQKALQMWWDTTDPEKNTSRAEKETRQTKSLLTKTAEQWMQQLQRPKWCEDVSRVCTQFWALGGRQIWQRMLTLAAPEVIVALARHKCYAAMSIPTLPFLASRVEKGWQQYGFWSYTDLSTWYR